MGVVTNFRTVQHDKFRFFSTYLINSQSRLQAREFPYFIAIIWLVISDRKGRETKSFAPFSLLRGIGF